MAWPAQRECCDVPLSGRMLLRVGDLVTDGRGRIYYTWYK